MTTILKNNFLYSNNTALKDDLGNSVTYSELFSESKRLISNIEQRSLMIILCDHSFETTKMIFKSLATNCVPLLFSSDIKNTFLKKVINIYHPKYLWCKKTRVSERIYPIIFEDDAYFLLEINKDKAELDKNLALLLSTSGSTGSSKLVKISYENLYDNVKHSSAHYGICENQKGITPLPFHHTFGLSFCFWHWYCGATLLITDKPIISKNFNHFFTQEQANNFAALPSTFQALNKVNFWSKEKLSHLHIAMSGGAQISDELQQELISLLSDKFWIIYGQTEATCIITATNFKTDNLKLGTVGKPLQNIKIYTDKKNGELISESKSVAMGYALSRADLSKGNTNNNLLRTGDAAVIDKDGYVYLKGRLNRYIKILGNRISLDEVQSVLQSVFLNYEFACVGSENKIMVYYSSPEKKDITEKLIIELHKLHIPRKFIAICCLPQLPKNKTGKLIYSALTI